jgi:hypothetical protein
MVVIELDNVTLALMTVVKRDHCQVHLEFGGMLHVDYTLMHFSLSTGL